MALSSEQTTAADGDERDRALPLSLVVGTIVVTVLPILLNLFGVDFAAEAPLLDREVFWDTGTDEALRVVMLSLSGQFVHTILEWSAFSIACLTVVLAFSYYRLERDVTVPIIGTAFFSAGVMDAFHTLAADYLVAGVAEQTDLIPFTWALSRIFTPLILILGASIALSTSRRGRAPGLALILMVSLALGLVAYGVIYVCATSSGLPRTMFPESLVTRPYDVVPLGLFLFFAAVVYPKFRSKNPGPFSQALLLATVPAIATQIHMAFGSGALFDNHFNIAHFLKIVVYLVPLGGLLVEYARKHDVVKSRSDELRYANERVSKIQERLELAVTGTSDGLWSWDISDGHVWYSPRFKELLGYAAHEFGDDLDTFYAHLHPDDVAETSSRVQRHLEDDVPYDTEYRLRTRDAEYRWFRARGVALRSAEGKPLRMAGSIQDVESRRRTETALVEAKEAAEHATRTKSAFLANMSHEIRTPMTAILGYTEFLLEDEQTSGASDEQLDAVRTIQINGQYLLELINDILDLSKIEAGKLEVECIPCYPVEILSGVTELMGVRTRSKGLDLDLVYATPIPETIQGDSTRIRQILINLIGNAIKFTEKGGILVTVALVEEEGKEPVLDVSVFDSGIGMEEKHLAGLFEPFTQADASTTRKFGGTGLGLSISVRLAELMGGDITVWSRTGYGSLFRLSVPTGPIEGVRRTDGERRKYSDPAAQDRRSICEIPEHSRLLLAEDNVVNQKLVARILEKAGAQVDVVGDGAAAVERAGAARDEENPYHVILMDMQMPILDGYGATRALRDRGYDLPIVALTANAMPSDRTRCLEAGCSDFATKPINRDELLATVARWARRAMDESPTT